MKLMQKMLNKAILPRNLQERYQLKLDEVLQDPEVYEKLKKQIATIKRKRMHKRKKKHLEIENNAENEQLNLL